MTTLCLIMSILGGFYFVTFINLWVQHAWEEG